MSFYSVIQFVPDSIADEKINVGVVAFDGDEVRVHFGPDWKGRARWFASGENVSYLDGQAETIAALSNEAAVRALTVRRPHDDGLQLTAPRGSTEPVDALLAGVLPVFLGAFEEVA